MNNVPGTKLNTKEKGYLGEKIACMFLVKHGFRLVSRNYLKKIGEIDIIAKKDKILHFIEVKSVLTSFLHIGATNRDFNPLDSVHKTKITRLKRTIRLYFLENHLDPDTEFTIDAIAVFVDRVRRTGRVYMLPDVV